MSTLIDRLRSCYMDTKRMIPCELEHEAADELEHLALDLQTERAAVAALREELILAETVRASQVAGAVQAEEKLKVQIKRLTREPDCRTCQHRLNCINTYPEAQDCTNGDRYEPLPPVRLYRRTT